MSSDANQTDPKQLLIVDADERSFRVLQISFSKEGYDVTTASTADEALAALEAASPELILVSAELGDESGIDLAEQIKSGEAWEAIPLFVVGDGRDTALKMRAFEIGAEEFISKPLYIKDVLHRAETAVARYREQRRLEAAASEETGSLEEVGLLDLLHAIHQARRTGAIQARRDALRGTVYFEDGEVIDAVSGRAHGEEALLRLCTWRRGEYETKYLETTGRQPRIERATQDLLSEALVYQNDFEELAAEIGPLDAVYRVDFKKFGAAADDLSDDAEELARLLDGVRTIEQAITESPLSDLDAMRAAGALLGADVLEPVAASDVPAVEEDDFEKLGTAEWSQVATEMDDEEAARVAEAVAEEARERAKKARGVEAKAAAEAEEPSVEETSADETPSTPAGSEDEEEARKLEAEAKRLEEQARKLSERAQAKAEAARKKAEEEARRKAEEEARRKAEEEAKRREEQLRALEAKQAELQRLAEEKQRVEAAQREEVEEAERRAAEARKRATEKAEALLAQSQAIQSEIQRISGEMQTIAPAEEPTSSASSSPAAPAAAPAVEEPTEPSEEDRMAALELARSRELEAIRRERTATPAGEEPNAPSQAEQDEAIARAGAVAGAASVAGTQLLSAPTTPSDTPGDKVVPTAGSPITEGGSPAAESDSPTPGTPAESAAEDSAAAVRQSSPDLAAISSGAAAGGFASGVHDRSAVDEFFVDADSSSVYREHDFTDGESSSSNRGIWIVLLLLLIGVVAILLSRGGEPPEERPAVVVEDTAVPDAGAEVVEQTGPTEEELELARRAAENNAMQRAGDVSFDVEITARDIIDGVLAARQAAEEEAAAARRERRRERPDPEPEPETTEADDVLAECARAYSDGRYSDALETCQEAIRLNPRSSDAFTYFGRAHYEVGNTEQAIDALERATSINSRNANALIILGAAHQELGNLGAARTAYESYLELRPQSRRAEEIRRILESFE